MVMINLFRRNGFPEKNELYKNDGRSDCNFSHLIETDAANDHIKRGNDTKIIS